MNLKMSHREMFMVIVRKSEGTWMMFNCSVKSIHKETGCYCLRQSADLNSLTLPHMSLYHKLLQYNTAKLFNTVRPRGKRPVVALYFLAAHF